MAVTTFVVASMLVTAYSTYEQSKAAKAQAKYQEAVSRNNQITAERDAAAIRERGKQEEADYRRRIAQTAGAARAAQGGGGFLVEGETNVNLVGDIYEEGEYDILKLRDDIELKARNKVIQANNFGAEAGFNALKASQQKPGQAATLSLIQNAGSVYSSYKGAQTPKAEI